MQSLTSVWPVRQLVRVVGSFILGSCVIMVVISMASDKHTEIDDTLDDRSYISFTNPPCKCPDTPPKPASTKSTRNLKILTWGAQNMNKPLDENWFQKADEDPFQVCYDRHFSDPSMRCTFTNDRTQLVDSDAVIFRARRLEDLPLPQRPNYNQQWIFYEVEPPYKVYEYTDLNKYNDIFNLSATYSAESDMPHLIDLKKCHINEKRLKRFSKMNFAANKTRQAAWFVTNCKSQSKREEFAKEMQKYLDVDIYGKCGNFTCGTNSYISWPEAKCHETLFNNKDGYRFYLAFENSICTDYLTEKLWKLVGHSVIPIVMGGVDYKNMLPSQTHVDVRDFGDAKKLTDFLLELSRNDDLYNTYVARWKSLVCEPWYPPYMPWQCKICEGLHKRQGRTRIIHDIARFWGTKKCVSPQEYHHSANVTNKDFNVTF